MGYKPDYPFLWKDIAAAMLSEGVTRTTRGVYCGCHTMWPEQYNIVREIRKNWEWHSVEPHEEATLEFIIRILYFNEILRAFDPEEALDWEELPVDHIVAAVVGWFMRVRILFRLYE